MAVPRSTTNVALIPPSVPSVLAHDESRNREPQTSEARITKYPSTPLTATADKPPTATMPPAAASSTSDQNQQSFRANLSQFRWARGTTDDSANAGPTSTSTTTSNGNGNPFSRFYNAVAGDYMPLRGGGGGEAQEEPGWFALSRWERCVLALLLSWGMMYAC